MIYVYDILLNFCDNDLVYDFYEWNNNDCVENIKRMKLIHVDSKLLNDIYYYNGEVDKDFLLKIFKTCEVYSGKKVNIIDYCILMSDGEVVIAFEFDKSGKVIFKSRLLLDEEDEIALLASNLELTKISFNKKEKILNKRFLTRNQMTIKNFLTREIIDSYKNKKYEKLKYLYQEYFDKDIISNKNMMNELLDSLNSDIDLKHLKIFNMLKLTKKKQV